MAATFNRNDRGVVAGVDGTNAFLPDDPAYAQTIGAFEALTNEHNQLSIVMKPEAIPAALMNSTVGRAAIVATSNTYGALLTRKREYETADRNARERAPSIADTRDDGEWRNVYRSLSPAEQAARISAADLRELAAIVAAPDLANLAPELRGPADERYLQLNFAERVGLAGNYPAMPSVTGDLLATGVDHVAVQQAAAAVLDRHRERGERSAGDEQALRSIVAYLAAAFNLPLAAVLERVQP